jgi:hypothetical protein
MLNPLGASPGDSPVGVKEEATQVASSFTHKFVDGFTNLLMASLVESHTLVREESSTFSQGYEEEEKTVLAAHSK